MGRGWRDPRGARSLVVVQQLGEVEAADRCRGKVIVISNRHEDLKEWEWAPAPDGRLLPKSYGHALSIETLLQGHSTIRVVDRYGQEIATLLAAALGAMIAGWWSSSLVRAMAAGAACSAFFVGLSLLVVRIDGFVCNPIVPSVAMWLAIVMVEATGALTVNLRAPIVINPKTMTGQQVLPHNCLYPLRHVLVDAE